MKDLLIIGAGGMGRDVTWLVKRINDKCETWNLLGFIDDNEAIQGKELVGCRVAGKISDIKNYPDAYVVCAIANAQARKRIIERIKADFPNQRFATLIDPTVEMSDYVEIGEGAIICAHTMITMNVKIGKHPIICSGSTIGHDTILGDYVTFYPNATVSGFTRVGDCCELGTGMQAIQEKTIGKNTIIGAGATVVTDIPENCTAVGVPAKPIKFRTS